MKYQMPEPACEVSPYEVNHVYWNAGHESAGCNSPLYTATQVQAAFDAGRAAGLEAAADWLHSYDGAVNSRREEAIRNLAKEQPCES